MANPPKKTTSRRAITSGPLAVWMIRYLQWLAMEPGGELSQPGVNKGAGVGVTWGTKTGRAGQIASRVMTIDSLKILEQRPDAIAYFEKFQADLAFRAKELISPDIQTNIEARREGLILAKNAQDHKAIEHYTRPFVDLAFPKKVQGEEMVPRITIYLGSKEAQALVGKVLNEPAEEVPDIEWEEVETKLLTDGEDNG